MSIAFRIVALAVLAVSASTCAAVPSPGAEPWMVVSAVAARASLRAAFTSLDAARAAGSRVDAGPIAIRAAVTRLDQAFLERRTPELASRLALARAATGDPRACLDALALIDESSRTADIWADEAGCALERGIREDNPHAMAQALEAALRALALDADHEVARRNQRRALFALGLAPPADPDPAGPFALLRTVEPGEDAPAPQDTREVRLAAAEPQVCDPSVPFLDGDPDLVREILMRCVLRRWAEHTLAGRADLAAAFADHAQHVGAWLASTTGDGCLSGLVNELVGCTGVACLEDARRWQLAVRAGMAIERGEQVEVATLEPALRRAHPRVADLVSGYASLDLATQARLRGDSPAARLGVRQVLGLATARACIHLKGRSAWASMLLAVEGGDVALAREQAEVALASLEASGDREAVAVAAGVAATVSRGEEEFEAAWHRVRRSLGGLWTARQFRRQSVLFSAAALSDDSGFRALGAFLRRHIEADARRATSWATLAFVLPERAEDMHAAGDSAEAAHLLSEGAAAIARVGEAGTRDLASVFHAQAFSVVHGPEHYQQARALLDAAIASQVKRGMVRRLPALRARAAIEAADAGDVDGVASLLASLPKGGALWWSTSAAVAERLWTRGLQDEARRVVDDAIGGTHEMSPPVTTLHFVTAPSLTLVRARGPRLDRLYTAGRSSGALASTVGTLHRLFLQERALPDFDRHLSSLFEDLLGPVRDVLRTERRVAVVPDGPLEGLPFGALREPATGRHLVEDHLVLQGGSHMPGPHPPPVRVLMAGGGTVVRGTAALPGSTTELASLTRLYADAGLTEFAVSPDTMLARLPGSDLFHFAGHAVTNTTRPGRSRLVIGPSDRDVVLASDIASLDLGSLDLAVLSACETAVGAATRGQLGLASAFLRAGARGVVATLWKVPDNASRELSLALHEQWKAGAPVAEALRHAQLAALQSHREEPWTWAAFVALQSSPAALPSSRALSRKRGVT